MFLSNGLDTVVLNGGTVAIRVANRGSLVWIPAPGINDAVARVVSTAVFRVDNERATAGNLARAMNDALDEMPAGDRAAIVGPDGTMEALDEMPAGDRAVIVRPDGATEALTEDDARSRAYKALGHAIEQIAKAQYAAAGKPKGKPGRPAFVATGDEVKALVKARGDVLSGAITPEQAMALVLSGDVMNARFPTNHSAPRAARKR